MVPVAVVAALVDDPVAADAAMAACEPVWHQPVPPPRAAAASEPGGLRRQQAIPWLRAARFGPADPQIGLAALACFEAADAALARSEAPDLVRAAVADFADRYVQRGRCPADDILDNVALMEGQS